MSRLFIRLMLFPFKVFVVGMEAMTQAILEVQHTFGDCARSRENLQVVTASPPGLLVPTAQDAGREGKPIGVGSQSEVLVDQMGNYNREQTMFENDELLCRDDEMALVRYLIHFTKRDYEVVFLEKTDSVSYETTVGDFKGEKKLEFIKDLRTNGRDVPSEWEQTDEKDSYPPANYLDPNNEDKFTGLPEEDRKKYLKVTIRDVSRCPRTAAQDERDQAQALKGIKTILGQIQMDGIVTKPPPPAAPPPAAPPPAAPPPPAAGGRRGRRAGGGAPNQDEG